MPQRRAMKRYTFPVTQHGTSIESPKTFFMEKIAPPKKSSLSLMNKGENNHHSQADRVSKNLGSDSRKDSWGKLTERRYFFTSNKNERSVCSCPKRLFKDLAEAFSWALFAAFLGWLFLGLSYQVLAPNGLNLSPDVNRFLLQIQPFNNDITPAKMPTGAPKKTNKSRKEILNRPETQKELPRTKSNHNGGKNEEKSFINS